VGRVRSVSTALERVFVERGDFKVFHEPALPPTTTRWSERFAATETKREYGCEEVLDLMLGVQEKPVYFEDMAYHVAAVMDDEFVSRFTNTFIIREPAPVLSSLSSFWPDFTLEETGYEQQHRPFEVAVENGEDPAVVDAADLTADPTATIRAYCEKLGVPVMPESLSWEPGEVPEWEMWSEWHEEVQDSTGIKREPLEGVYESCLSYYEELHAKRVRSDA
jgi:hypothetical protein